MKKSILLAVGAILALIAAASFFGCATPPDIGPWYRVTRNMKCRHHYYADKYSSVIECTTIERCRD